MKNLDGKPSIVGDEFVDGFRFQTEWVWLIAIAFFLGGIGAGLFLVAVFFQFKLAALLGLFIVAFGKGGAHLLYLGHPLRAWRVILKPGSSWISRGMIATVVFTFFGFLWCAEVVPGFGWLVIKEGTFIEGLVISLAVISALIISIYDGLVMSSSPSLPFWNTALLPMFGFNEAFLGGVTLTILLIHFGIGENLSVNLNILELVEVGLLLLNLLLLVVYLMTMFTSNLTAKVSALLLLRGKYAFYFLGGGIFAGFILTLFLIFYFYYTHQILALVGVALAELLGDFVVRFTFLKVGVYTPLSYR